MNPRIGEPCQTRPAAEVLAEKDIGVPPVGPLPDLSDPPHPPVLDPVVESLVRVAHPRIQLLECYRRAGWQSAVPDCWLRRSVAERLGRVADDLPERWGLAVFDGWRPFDLQVELYRAAYTDPNLPPGFFAEPDDDLLRPPPHLSGGAVDLTLTVDGIPLGPGTDFDDLTPLARTAALEHQPGPNRDVRRFLNQVMASKGFVVFDGEWWHFEYGTRRWAAITGGTPRFGPAGPAD